jgi:hypothetical protein
VARYLAANLERRTATSARLLDQHRQHLRREVIEHSWKSSSADRSPLLVPQPRLADTSVTVRDGAPRQPVGGGSRDRARDPDQILLGPDAVVAQPAGPAACVSANRVWQRRRIAVGDGGGAYLGQPRSRGVRRGLGEPADDPARRRWPHFDPARVGQQRLDDLLLFRGRAGGTAGVRPWRAATATSGRASGVGGPGGHDRAGRDLSWP